MIALTFVYKRMDSGCNYLFCLSQRDYDLVVFLSLFNIQVRLNSVNINVLQHYGYSPCGSNCAGYLLWTKDCYDWMFVRSEHH